MVTITVLDELRSEHLWQEVKPDADEFCRDRREKQCWLVKTLLEGAVEEKLTVLLEVPGSGGRRHAEAGANGSYQRNPISQ